MLIVERIENIVMTLKNKNQLFVSLFKKYAIKIKYVDPKNILILLINLFIKRKIVIKGFNEGTIIERLLNKELKSEKDVYENIEKILLSMQTKDLIDIVQMSDGIYKAKEDIQSILEYINVMLLELSRQNKKYINCVEIVEDTKKRLKANSNYDMCIDNLLFNMKSIIAN